MNVLYLYKFFRTAVFDQDLHDGVNFFHHGAAVDTSAIQQRPAVTPSGVKYDPYGWNDAPIIPGTVTQEIRCVTTTSPAMTAKEAYQALLALLGLAGYVDAYEAGYSPANGYYEARARLYEVTYRQPDEIVGDVIWATLKFELYENWDWRAGG